MSQFERIVYIDRLLRERGGVRTRQVAERFEVTDRQVKRDIEYLRDRVSAPIAYDRPSRLYRYKETFDTLRFADEKLLIFYVLVKSIALNECYVPVVTADLLAELESHVSPAYRTVSDRIQYELPIVQSVNMDDFTLICEAMMASRRLDIEYESLAGKRTERQVEPERFVNYGGRWYLVAFDLLRNDLRTFHLSRMVRVAMSRAGMSRGRAGADQKAVNAYIASGFGIFNGPAIKRATIRIYGQAARAVEHQIWHPEQKVTTGLLDPGSASSVAAGEGFSGVPYTDLTLPVADWREILGRVLSFGAAAEVLTPEEFRDQWRAEVEKLAARAGLSVSG